MKKSSKIAEILKLSLILVLQHLNALDGDDVFIKVFSISTVYIFNGYAIYFRTISANMLGD